jgi:hypothetical protein
MVQIGKAGTWPVLQKKSEVPSFILIRKLLRYSQLLIRGLGVNHSVSAACEACT